MLQLNRCGRVPAWTAKGVPTIMKLLVFNPVLGDMPFESAMQYLAQCGVGMW